MSLKLWHTALLPQYENKIHPTTLSAMNGWIAFNPEVKIQRTIANDDFCKSFLEEFDKVYETETLKYYNTEEDGRFKSDLFRLCALLKEGGMYIDIDQLPLKQMSEYLDLNYIDFCVGVLAPSNYVCNGILYAKNPDNKIIKACLDEHIKTYKLKEKGLHDGDMSAIHTMHKTIRSMFEDNNIPKGHAAIEDYNCLFLEEREGVNAFMNAFYFEEEAVMATRYFNYHRDKVMKSEHVTFKEVETFNENSIEKYKSYMDSAFDKWVEPDEWHEHFGRKPLLRYETTRYCWDYVLKNELKQVVELGTSRSFVDGAYPGCNTNDTTFWQPENPSVWDWSAGCFTRVVGECIQGTDIKLDTIDMAQAHIFRSHFMTQELEGINYGIGMSESFLQNYDKKIDFLYLDTGDVTPVDFTAELHLREAKIIIEKDIMSEKGIILIDDVRNVACKKQNKDVSDYGKAKLSIPFFLNHGWKITMDEYQVALERNK